MHTRIDVTNTNIGISRTVLQSMYSMSIVACSLSSTQCTFRDTTSILGEQQRVPLTASAGSGKLWSDWHAAARMGQLSSFPKSVLSGPVQCQHLR